MIINLKVRKYLLFLFIVSINLGLLNAIKREAFGADFLTYEKYYYAREFFVEPIYLIIQNLFSFLNIPFLVFWMVLTTFSIYQVGLFSLSRARSETFYLLILPLMFFLTLSGHSRSGFALGVFCWSMNRGNTLSKSLFFGGMMHAGAMVVFCVNFLISKEINLKLKIGFIMLFLCSVYIILQYFYLFLEEIGKANYVRMLSLSYLNSDHFQHRNLWSFNNLRLWFWLLLLCYLIAFNVFDRSLYTTLAVSYVIFGFDAYIAQKTTLIFLPLIALVFLHRHKTTSIVRYACQVLGAGMVAIISSLDIAERLYLL